MKISGIITLGLAVLMLTFTACENDPDEPTSDVDALELDSEAAQESTFEAVDQVVEDGISSLDAARIDMDRPLADCAVVTHDTENKIITIDFGEGCEDRKGNLKQGKIVIEYNFRAYIPGAFRKITFVDFFFNGIGVEGVRTLTNTSSVDSQFQFTVTLVGGKLDFGDDIFATRDAEWVRTWFVGEGQVTLSGGAEGTNINGINYSATINASTPLVFLRDCNKLPVSGIKEMMVGDRSASINFGDGECDRIVEITINGKTVIREITPRDGKGR